MQKPVIMSLSAQEQVALLQKINSDELNPHEKKIISELIQFMGTLKDKLNSSEITIAALKRLFGCSGETLKKLLQIS